MAKMIFFGLLLFAMAYGGFKALQGLDVFEFESVIKEISVVAGVAGFVIVAIVAVIVLF